MVSSGAGGVHGHPLSAHRRMGLASCRLSLPPMPLMMVQALGACEHGEDVGAGGVGGALRDIQHVPVDGPSWARSSRSLLARDSAALRAWLVRMSSSVRPRKSMACCERLASSHCCRAENRDDRRGAERLAVQFLRSITPSAGTPANQWCAPFYDQNDWLLSF